MGLKATIDDKVIIFGSGTSLIRLKDALSNSLPPDTVKYSGRDRITMPVSILGIAKPILEDHKCDFDSAISEKIESMERLIDAHVEASNKIIRYQEEEKYLIGDDYWDGILDPHQGIAVKAMILKGLLGMCIFDEQGTGKTLSAIASFDILKRNKIIEVLFLIGPKSLLGNWEVEINKFLPNTYSIRKLEGSIEKKFRALSKKENIYLLNYEAVQSLMTPLKSIGRDFSVMLVIDESYFIKNSDAKRSKAVKELRRYCKKGFVLCGTPAPNNPNEIINQFDVADNGYTFLGFTPLGESEADRNEILNRIGSRGVYLRRTKTDTLPDLPEKNFEIIKVHMVGQQANLYEKAREDLYLYLKRLDNTEFKRNLTTYFQRRAALNQICITPSMIDPLCIETPAKYKVLDNILEKLITVESEKVVIWANYTRTIDDLKERFNHYGLVLLDGRVKSMDERTELVKSFQNDSSVMIFLGNPAAAGFGLNLQVASNVVYASLPSQTANYFQSLDRIHRRGQKAESVNYNILICEGTLEERDLKKLFQKEIRQKELLGDEMVSVASIEKAIAELENL